LWRAKSKRAPPFWLNYRDPNGRAAGVVVMQAQALVAARVKAAVAEKKNDSREGAAVVQAYVKLVDCIAMHRDRRTMCRPENRADIWQDS